jgi:negative regulator of flagellin synthesis FlgM
MRLFAKVSPFLADSLVKWWIHHVISRAKSMDINGLNKSASQKTTQANGQQTAAAAKVSAQNEAVVRQSAASPRQDTFMLSTEAQKITRLQRQMDSSTPVNREKVESIKAAIARGDYHVDARKVAEKLLSGDDLFA